MPAWSFASVLKSNLGVLPPDKHTVAILLASFVWLSNSISRLANVLATFCGVSKDFTFGIINEIDGCSVESDELFRAPNINADECYFKAGCYLQSTQSSHHDSNVFGQVLVRDLSVTPDD